MSGSRLLVSATLLGLAVGAAPAAEVVGSFVDLRLSGGITSGDYSVDVSNNEPARKLNYSDDGTFDENYRVTLNWVGSLGLRSYGGWLWGIGGTYNSHRGATFQVVRDSGAIADATNDVIAWSADGFIGYAVPFGEHFQLELLPFIGAGRAYLDNEDVGGDTSSTSEKYLEAGFDLNGVFTFNNGFQLGATAGYMYWETSLHNGDGIPAINKDNRQKYAQWDPHFLLFIGCRL